MFIDSITHIVTGACVGEALLGKQLGKKAMLLGALAQSLPDIDAVAVLWNDTSSYLLAHRGFTHSILFDILVVIALSFLAKQFDRQHNLNISAWLLFFLVQVSLHIFLDLFNNYGVGLFEPFNHQRFSLNAIYVADPLFSIWPTLAAIVLLGMRKNNSRRTSWWKFGLYGAFLYLAICLFNKTLINNKVKNALVQQQIPYQTYLTTPAPLNNLLWFIAVPSGDGFYVSYLSVFDNRDSIRFEYFPRNENLLKNMGYQEDLEKLKTFSQGFYTIEHWNDTLVFNDLRFGQVIGWYDPREKFAFHYFLQHPDASNRLVVQRGRFAKWNDRVVGVLWRRMWGIK